MSNAPESIHPTSIQRAAERACRLLRVLSNPDRLAILCLLTNSEHSVGQIEQALGIRQPTLSQQLSVLREEALVSTRRDGKNIHYSIASDDAQALIRVLHERFCPQGTDTP